MLQPQTVTTLKKRADFLRAAASGDKKVTRNIVVQIFRRPDGENGGVRVGFTVTKKTGNAVCRNRIKRRLRALVRGILPQSGAAGIDVVLIGRYKAATCPFSELEQDFCYALRKLGAV